MNGELSEERRRERDRKRREDAKARREREGAEEPREAKRTPRQEPKEEEAPQSDPRLIAAVAICCEAFVVEEITPEFKAKANAVMLNALQFFIEVRLPLVGDEWAPETALACGVTAIATMKVRESRAKKKGTVQGRVVVDPPPPPPDPSNPNGGA